MALVEQLHSKGFLYKSSFIGLPQRTAGYIRLLQDIRTAMPDRRVVVEDCIGERKVFTWSTLIRHHRPADPGLSGQRQVLSAISAMGFWVFNPQGQLQELCTMFDMESFRAQLGLQTRPFAEKALPSQPS